MGRQPTGMIARGTGVPPVRLVLALVLVLVLSVAAVHAEDAPSAVPVPDDPHDALPVPELPAAPMRDGESDGDGEGERKSDAPPAVAQPEPIDPVQLGNPGMFMEDGIPDEGMPAMGLGPNEAHDPTDPRLGVAGAEDGPGRVAPAAPAEPLALEFAWDSYRTLVVIGPGRGLRRPAWIVTWQIPPAAGWGLDAANTLLGTAGLGIEPPQPTLAVAYRAVAACDATGVIHLDARTAWIAGSMADQWSPDSFAIHLPNRVDSLDDLGNTQQGAITRLVDPRSDPQEYRRLKAQAQGLVGGGI